MMEILVLPVAFFAALGQSATYDPINQMCSRWSHQSVVKNNVLFIDGKLFFSKEKKSFPKALFILQY